MTFNFDSKIRINIAKTEDFFDLNLCAKEFIDFIDDFKKKFLDKRFFVLTAFYDDILAGILVAEDRTQMVNTIKNLIPTVYLRLIYINPRYRKKDLGKKLLSTFLEYQKNRGTALISIKLPQKYKKGIIFFQKNGFVVVNKDRGKLILELYLWNDFGVRECQIISEDFYNAFNLE